MSALEAAGMRVAELAVEQWGLITTAQARTLGVTPVQLSRLTTQGALERAHHGIYRMARIAHDPDEDLHLAWIATDTKTPAAERLARDHPGAVVSHESAARQLKLGDLPADLVELTTPHRVRLRLPDIRIHVDPELMADEWNLVNGLPVTTALRTITDLTAEHIDGEHLGTIIRDALVRNMCDVDEVASAIAPYAFNYGYALGEGREMVDDLVATAGVSKNTMALSQAATKAQVQGIYENYLRQNPNFTPAMASIAQTVAALQPSIAEWAATSGINEATKTLMAAYQPPMFDTEQLQRVIAKAAGLGTINSHQLPGMTAPNLATFWATQPALGGALSGHAGKRAPARPTPPNYEDQTTDETRDGA